jgi:hypothetical protein
MSSEKTEGSPGIEKANPQEIIISKVIPVISSYSEQLSKDPAELARERDFLLGEMPQRDLERNQRNLKHLKEFLKEFARDPNAFKLTFKNDPEDPFAHLYLLSLRDPKDPSEPSTNPDLPDTELNIQIILLKEDAPELSELREERLRALGRNIPPDRALERSQEQAPKEMTLFLTAAQVYWRRRKRTLGFAPEPDYKRHVNYESGIALCRSSQEGTLSYGVFYLGGTPHYSRIYEEIEICQEECEILRDFLVGYFLERSKEGIPPLKFQFTSPNK